MRQQSRQKRFHYRRVEGFAEEKDLDQILRQILFTTHSKVAQRWQELEGDDPKTKLRLFINKRRRYRGMVCGTLVLYESGRNREVLALAEDQEELEVEQMQASEAEDGHEREFIDATLYFGVSGNHVIVVQTQALSARSLESHLRWLVDEHAQQLDDGEYLVLEQALSVTGTQAVKKPRSVVVGAPFSAPSVKKEDEQSQAAPDSKIAGAINEVVATHRGSGRSWLEGMFDEDTLREMRLERFTEADNLVVEVHVRRVGRASKEDEKDVNRDAMEVLTKALRHQHPEDLKIETEKMGDIRGDELHVWKKISVDHINGVPQAEHVFQKMQDWLRECIADGIIKP